MLFLPKWLHNLPNLLRLPPANSLTPLAQLVVTVSLDLNPGWDFSEMNEAKLGLHLYVKF